MREGFKAGRLKATLRESGASDTQNKAQRASKQKKNEENEFNDEEARGRSENALPVPVLKLPLPAPSWTSLRLCGDRCNTGQGPQPRGPRASAQHHHPAAAHPAE